jgi:hypothetical protein
MAGVKPHELVQRFSAMNKLEAWNNTAFCSAYAGIGTETASLIFNESMYLDNNEMMTAYGLKTYDAATSTYVNRAGIKNPTSKGNFITFNNSNWISVVTGRVDVFLQQTGLTYTELLQLLDCYAVNPASNSSGTIPRPLSITTNSSTVAPDTCNLAQLKIEGATAELLARLCRFVRLAKSLKWDFYTLDAILGGREISEDVYRQVIQTHYLAALMKLKPEVAYNISAGLHFMPYRDYTKSEPTDILTPYARVYRNPALANIDAEDYPFVPFTVEDHDTVPYREIAVVQNYLSGIYNVSGKIVEAVLAKIKGYSGSPEFIGSLVHVNNHILSDVYREIMLIKTLKLKLEEWQLLNKVLQNNVIFGTVPGSTDPFDQNTGINIPSLIRYAYFTQLIKTSGLTNDELNYLVFDSVNNTDKDKEQDDKQMKVVNGLKAELKKQQSKGYDAYADSEGLELMSYATMLLGEEDAQEFIRIVQKVVVGAETYTPAEIAFVSTKVSPIMADAVNKLTNVSHGSFIADGVDRRQAVYSAIAPVVDSTILKNMTSQYLAQAFSITEMVSTNFLEVIVDGTGTAAIDRLTEATFINEDGEIGRFNATYKRQIEAVIRLSKAALLINKFKLSALEAQSFLAGAAAYDLPAAKDFAVRTTADTPATATIVFRKFLRLMEWMHVKTFLGDNSEKIFAVIAAALVADTNAKKASVVKDLAAIFKMGTPDLAVLLGDYEPSTPVAGVLGAVFSNNKLTNPVVFRRIIDCLEMQYLLPAPMTALSGAAVHFPVATDLGKTQELIQMVRSLYDETSWAEAARPVNDRLRVERRDALLAYLLVNPPDAYKYKWYTVNDIYETLMIDVEMMSCMSTTRILQAVNTVQVWVERIILGLEGLTLAKNEIRQWNNWRKLYRLWEANRKIFVYPENWIEPELRDNKTPFFKELEKTLKQNDVTQEMVEDAYRTYLERLDEVSHLDVVATYRETTQAPKDFVYPNGDVFHVIARTPSFPHLYYYRKHKNDEWTPWEKMEVQIDGDHFVAEMWRGRLRLYWLHLAIDRGEDNGERTPAENKTVKQKDSRWRINLGWSELKNGKWSPKQLSKDALYSHRVTDEVPKDMQHILDYDLANNSNIVKHWFLRGGVERQKKMINFYAFRDGDTIQFVVSERVRCYSQDIKNYINNLMSTYQGGESPREKFEKAIVQLNGYLDRSEEFYNNKGVQVTSWIGCPGTFTAKFSGVYANDVWFPTVYNKALEKTAYQQEYNRFWYDMPVASGYQHLPDQNLQLLGKAPDNDEDVRFRRYITMPLNTPTLLTGLKQIPQFFYKDFRNCFYVEKVYEESPLTGAIPVLGNGNGVINVTSGSSGYNWPGLSSGAITSAGFNASSNTTFQVTLTKAVKYRFHNFYHDKVDDLMEKLYSEGLEGMLNRSFVNGLMTDSLDFSGTYKPSSYVKNELDKVPRNGIDFNTDSAFGMYNWELFLHIPMLIAGKLAQNQQFDEARRWYHFVFDPTATTSTVSGFWNFTEFYRKATVMPTIEEVMKDSNLDAQVKAWADDPFKPHLIARTRTSAYMKHTVMKYLDNLIAWGDMLFSLDTRESINEASLLYVVAAQILGRKPVTVPARATPVTHTYASLVSSSTLNAFGNAMVQIESMLMPSGVLNNGKGSGVAPGVSGSVINGSMFYFCFPTNDKMKGYWDTIADRLFKIRNCQNIQGIERELALYDPPIDPAILVKAVANGVPVGEVISGLYAPLPLYRYNVIVSKASELAQEVKSLGGQILGAIEKKDSESLALLRSSQELKVLEAVTDLRQKQLDESVQQLEGLKIQKTMVTQRRDYYQRLVTNGLNEQERQQLNSINATMPITLAQGAASTTAGILHAIPNAKVSPTCSGVTFGGTNMGSVANAAASALGTAISMLNTQAQTAGIHGGNLRRKEDWDLQLRLATSELQQIEKQIIAAEIRKAIAEVEQKNHELQIENNKQMDEAMRNKFSNEELYDWMIGELSGTYFQSYKMALDMAKKAERCYRFELGIDTSDFIQFTYWDSLKKGLLAGEQLMFDIKRLDLAYLENNKRHLELTKHVSLAQWMPDALELLKTNKRADFSLPEWLFDMDYPGQHMRRIKSISISIPSVTGPYTTISCKLSLIKSRYRKTPTYKADDYYEIVEQEEGRFVQQFGNIQSIATSGAQNDSGLFELNFRDERYLPFEGSGVISNWRIELPPTYAQFDYNSISDVIVHVKYTALDGNVLKVPAGNALGDLFKAEASDSPLLQAFSLKHDFSNEWNAYQYNNSLAEEQNLPFLMPMYNRYYPFFSKDQGIAIQKILVYPKPKAKVTENYQLEILNDGNPETVVNLGHLVPGAVEARIEVDGNPRQILLKRGTTVVPLYDVLDDLIIVVQYMWDSSVTGGETGGPHEGIGYWRISTDFIVS